MDLYQDMDLNTLDYSQTCAMLGLRGSRWLLLSLGFSESSDRRSINLAARMCKLSKAPAEVCRSPLRRLS